MANLKETAQWETGIYQLETSDPVMGGEDGVDNRQAKQLANRTAYLKEQVESLNSGKAESNHTHTIAQITDLQNTLNSKATNTDLTNAQNALTTEINKKATKDAFSALHDLLVGIPFPYPLSTVPSGCLAMNGQKFNTSTYPILAKKYPSGVLPDLRGEFIRGWDNGRGVDSGRNLLSLQGDAIRNLEGRISGIVTQFGGVLNATGVFKVDPTKFDNIFGSSTKVSDYGDYLGFDASLVVPTASENRPRNIAFHYICLAA